MRKVALSADDDKRIQDGNQTWAYGTSVGIICRDELEVKAWHPDRAYDWCFDDHFYEKETNKS